MKTRSLKQISVAARKKIARRIQNKSKPSKRVLTPRKGKHTDKPVYLSGTYTEYFIRQDDFGFFYIKAYRTSLNKELSGRWSDFEQAEKALINWLEKTDKRAQSRYPGCPERRETNYTRTFLADL